MVDATNIARIMVGFTTGVNGIEFTPQQLANANVNGGEVNSSDSIEIRNYVNETSNTFPACTPPTNTPTPTSTVTPTPTATPIPFRTVSGQVYEDKNNNSVLNGATPVPPTDADTPFTNSIVRILAFNSSNVPTGDGGYSNIATGNYTTTQIVPGATYRMRPETIPIGYTLTQNPSVPVSTTNVNNINIGLYQADTCHDGENNNSSTPQDCNDTFCHTDIF